MKIVFLDRKTIGIDISLDKFKIFGNVVCYDSTTSEQTLKRVKDAQIIVTNKVVIDQNIMENSNIKLICIAATGMNNIDLEYAKKKNIIVKNVVGYSTSSVAQLTISYVLHFIQHINYYNDYATNGNWTKSDIFTNNDKPFYELSNKKWGIIALGNIGKKVANIASSFNCQIQYYSTSGNNNNSIYSQLSLEELLKTSDIISIHAPLNKQTLNLLNKSNLNLLKDEMILINVGRGGIVNEQDITNELNKRVLYFATDVVTTEPIKNDSPLLNIKNKEQLIITPHIAWASIESRERLIETIFDNIKTFI